MAHITIGMIAFAMSVVVTASAADVSAKDSQATQQVIRNQISAFQAMDHEKAFSYASPKLRDIFKSTDRFIQMVKNGYKPLYDPEQYSFGRNTLLHGEVYQEVLVTDEKGKQWQAVYTLKKQPDGSWKITGVKMEPYTGAST